ncbi:MAG: hypothetical protein CBB87_03990 [Micavibrio sp. TMED27]|nr:hypothetical protein [Micavibrio sp.]OUT91982.1 MAG: hypothetical protein CBB87_03990 [Micavibrio sp. TMED27]|tara:strand:- start:1777 stop:2454 length:678 start_codon:yes stop_codon:yes gene_type:complete
MLPDHVQIKESTRAKRLALRLDPKSRIFNLVIPKGMSMRKAMAFAEQHESWMQDRLMDMPIPILLEDGVTIPILGRKRCVDIHYDDSFKRTDIKLSDDYLEVRTNKDKPAERIKRFLKEYAKKELQRLSIEKAQEINKDIKSVSVRDTISRWGSCSHDGKISYSWRLIFAPYEAIDYVVAHEVAHLEHLDHSRAFWSVCRSLSKDYLTGHSWMKEHASDELMRYI